MSHNKDAWNSRVGVIFAVAGGAVGLGNFLRFPGQVAQFGGGAFMIAYFIALLIIGLPLGWAEWTMGRYGGQKGFSAAPGVFTSIWKRSFAKYLGIFAILIPLGVFTYYVYIQAWCLGYAVNYLMGMIQFDTISESTSFWANFVGVEKDGSALGFGLQKVGGYIIIAFIIDFFLIFRGVSKGIEFFTKRAIPILILLGLIILVRVITLGSPDPENPQNSINNGLGFMWNPNKLVLQEFNKAEDQWVTLHQVIGTEAEASERNRVAASPSEYRIQEKTIWDQLQSPKLWLAAAQQIFLSLCLGAGAIIVYASYMKKDDDVVLSNLSSTSANEFTEVAIGGLMTIPAGFAFLGAIGVEGVGTFGLGFNVLPMVFSKMPMGQFFGFLFFFLLFLASVSAVLAMLQPGKAFLQEVLQTSHLKTIGILLVITTFSSSIVFWFTKDLKALDTFDFWITFFMFIMVTFEIITFGWALGVDKGMKEANRGAAFPIPAFFKPIFKYVCPIFLISIFVLWILIDVFGYGGQGIDKHIVDLFGGNGNPPSIAAWFCIGNLVLLASVYVWIVSRVKRYQEVVAEAKSQ